MMTEREALLRALQHHLQAAAEQLARLMAAEQQDRLAQPLLDPAKSQAQLAAYNHAYWKAQTLRATSASVFDRCFHNAFPQWKGPNFVRTVRRRIGRFDELGAAQLCEALQQYERQFAELRQVHERLDAHELAIAAVRDAMVEFREG